MPLYDFLCEDCGFADVIQMKYKDKLPTCTRCGSDNFVKQISIFQTSGSKTRQPMPPPEVATKPSHVHKSGSACSHGHSDHSHHAGEHSCSASKIDKLIAQHEKQARPTTIRGT